jgi:hypothetical protein
VDPAVERQHKQSSKLVQRDRRIDRRQGRPTSKPRTATPRSEADDDGDDDRLPITSRSH